MKKNNKSKKLPGAEKKTSDKPRSLIANFPITVTIIYGSTKINLYELTAFKPGKLIELDQYLDEPLEICVNGHVIAYGVLEKNNKGRGWGIKITEIKSRVKRLNCL